ncbi:hypothetical protein MBLNU13_g03806t1 [Cladosporium sp. NU13]
MGQLTMHGGQAGNRQFSAAHGAAVCLHKRGIPPGEVAHGDGNNANANAHDDAVQLIVSPWQARQRERVRSRLLALGVLNDFLVLTRPIGHTPNPHPAPVAPKQQLSAPDLPPAQGPSSPCSSRPLDQQQAPASPHPTDQAPPASSPSQLQQLASRPPTRLLY